MCIFLEIMILGIMLSNRVPGIIIRLPWIVVTAGFPWIIVTGFPCIAVARFPWIAVTAGFP